MGWSVAGDSPPRGSRPRPLRWSGRLVVLLRVSHTPPVRPQASQASEVGGETSGSQHRLLAVLLSRAAVYLSLVRLQRGLIIGNKPHVEDLARNVSLAHRYKAHLLEARDLWPRRGGARAGRPPGCGKQGAADASSTNPESRVRRTLRKRVRKLSRAARASPLLQVRLHRDRRLRSAADQMYQRHPEPGVERDARRSVLPSESSRADGVLQVHVQDRQADEQGTQGQGATPASLTHYLATRTSSCIDAAPPRRSTTKT